MLNCIKFLKRKDGIMKTDKKVQGIFALTPLQKGILFNSTCLSEHSEEYVIQNIYSCKTRLNKDIIIDTLDKLITKYEALRTLIFYKNINEPRQVIYDSLPINFFKIENQSDEENIETLALYDRKKGFKLDSEPLLRTTYVEGKDKDFLFFTVHHIILDGWSLSRIIAEFFELYQDTFNNVHENRISDNSLCEIGSYIEWLEQQDITKAKNYWSEYLNDYEKVCNLYSISSSESNEVIEDISMTLSEEVTESIVNLSKQAEVTVNSICEYIWGFVLSNQMNSRDIVFGKIVSGRDINLPNIDNFVGFTINTIPKRIRYNIEHSLQKSLKDNQYDSLNSSNYSYLSLTDIRSDSLTGSKIIDSLYVFENYYENNITDLLNKLGITKIKTYEYVKYPLSMAVSWDEQNLLKFKLLYSTNIIKHSEGELLLKRLKKAIRELVVENKRLADIDLLIDEEKDLILSKFNHPILGDTLNNENSLIDCFKNFVTKIPDSPAVIFKSNTITYKELDNLSNKVAQKLINCGLKKEDFVAIISDRSVEMIVSILGVLKAGGAYIPIDPHYPSDRILYMLKDSNQCRCKSI